MNESFHVRTAIPNAQIINGERKARSLESFILESFKQTPGRTFTEYDFYNVNGREMLFTSVRRSLSNLRKSGFITACDPSDKIMGRRGVSITTYTLAKNQPNQLEFKWN